MKNPHTQIPLEEQEHFDRTLGLLRRMANRCDQTIEQLDRQLHAKGKIITPDDWDGTPEIAGKKSKAKQGAARYRNLMDQPYFGRMDVATGNGNPKTFYVGEEGLSDQAEDILIVDWRAPLGSHIYDRTHSEFTVAGTRYKWMLHRQFDVRGRRLWGCSTLYDGRLRRKAAATPRSVETPKQGEMDPFLMKLLEKRRNAYELQNIIATIQENQNRIMRLPATQSFIVQGCAGSGKTMILLHRLSVVLYNAPKFPRDRICIITPNRQFDRHISGLSQNLGLQEVPRFTLASYYNALMGRLSGKTSAFTPPESENGLNPRYLQRVYSQDFLEEMIEEYHDHWRVMLERLRALGGPELLGERWPDPSVHGRESWLQLKQGFEELLRPLEKQTARQSEQQMRLDEAAVEYDGIDLRIAQALTELEQAQVEARNALREEIEHLRKTLPELEEQIAQIEPKRKELEQKVLPIDRCIGEIDQMFHRLDAWLLLPPSWGQLKEDPSYMAAYLCKKVDGAAIDLQNAIAGVKSSKGGKKKAAQLALTEATQSYRKALSAAIHSLRTQLLKKRSELRDTRATYTLALNDLTRQASSLEQQLAGRHAFLGTLTQLLDRWDEQAFPSLHDFLPTEVYRHFDVWMDLYELARETYNRLQTRKVTLKRRIERLREEVQQVDADTDLRNEALRQQLQNCLKVTDRLRIGAILRDCLRSMLEAVSERYDQPYPRGNYHHKLYLKLLFHTLYHPPLKTPDRLVCIDEAQDVSAAELGLLRAIHGKNCAFNLYGDLNQVLYPYRGIEDWTALECIPQAADHLYTLRENYRNPIQITNLCNQEFGTDLYPFGVKGTEVEQLSAAAAVERLRLRRRKNPKLRTAILYKRLSVGALAWTRRQLGSDEAVWMETDPRKISVLPVEMARGLEFDAVVVLTHRMERNDRYVAYTRSLGWLAVAEESFPDDGTDAFPVQDTAKDYLEDE